jgi:uncharacterized membrane protein
MLRTFQRPNAIAATAIAPEAARAAVSATFRRFAPGAALGSCVSMHEDDDDDPDGARRPTMTQTRSQASGKKHKTMRQRLRKVIRPLPEPINPALLEAEKKRADNRQNQVSDAITAFSGSMLFVYVHIIWFSCWIGFGVEKYPYGLLTMIVSLEAIFLSTFVLISQNRADAKRQVIADAQWRTVKEEDKQTSSCSGSRTRSWRSPRRCGPSRARSGTGTRSRPSRRRCAR